MRKVRIMTEAEKDALADARPLKLFVVGEQSGNPENWHVLGGRAIVAARSAEEAVGMTRFCGSEVAEVCFREPIVLFVEHEDGSRF